MKKSEIKAQKTAEKARMDSLKNQQAVQPLNDVEKAELADLKAS